MRLNLANLTVGQEVAISCSSTWSVRAIGVFKVVARNKVRITFKRDSDGYELVASVRTGKFQDHNGVLSDSSKFVEDVAAQQTRYEQQRREVAQRHLFQKIEGAAANRRLNEIEELVAQLKAL